MSEAGTSSASRASALREESHRRRSPRIAGKVRKAAGSERYSNGVDFASIQQRDTAMPLEGGARFGRRDSTESNGSGSRRRNGSGGSERSLKVQMIRSSSDELIVKKDHQGLQLALFAGTILLTGHSLWVIWNTMLGHDDRHIVPLSDRPLWDQLLLVWCSGWITAASTGLGALPFVLMGKPGDQAVAVCNAVAAGMMTAASIGLVAEGCLEESTPDTVFIPPVRVLFGVYLGIGFVKATSNFFEGAEPLEMLESPVTNMKRVFLIMTVMTLHSISEGIGIGVSFHSEALGGFVSATLAIHNVPEGVAIAIVLFPRGFSFLSVTLWCIFSSLPQPAMAVPAYLFTQQFAWVFPLGLGVAAGAMGLVVGEELLPEAMEHLSPNRTYLISVGSMIIMGLLQLSLRQSSL